PCATARGYPLLLQITGHRLSSRYARTVLRAHRDPIDIVDRRRRDRFEHLHLLVANAIRLERPRRLHREQRKELEHVVLDEISQRAGVVVIAGASLDTDVLRRGDLDVIYVVAIPSPLEL